MNDKERPTKSRSKKDHGWTTGPELELPPEAVGLPPHPPLKEPVTFVVTDVREASFTLEPEPAPKPEELVKQARIAAYMLRATQAVGVGEFNPAAMITQLADALAASTMTMVSERQPNRSGYYLTYRSVPDEVNHEVSYFDAKKQEWRGVYWDDGLTRDVSHWMPLPKVPA